MRIPVGVVVLAVASVACSSSPMIETAGIPRGTAGYKISALRPPPSITTKSSGFLYVASAGAAKNAPLGVVAVYAGSSLVKSISKNIDVPAALWKDNEQRLYVSNSAAKSISIYRQSGVYVRRLTRAVNHPSQLLLNSKGDMYVIIHSRDVNLFVKAKQSRLKRIEPNGPVYSIAGDALNNVYVGSEGEVTVYQPDSIEPSRTISDGVVQAASLAVDASGDLFVGNNGGNSCGNIEVYSPNQSAPSRSITTGVCNPSKMVFDSSGNLYVANVAWGGVPSSVTVYTAGSADPEETITLGVSFPVSLALDPAGNLYVANRNANDVTVYGPGSTHVAQTLTDQINDPTDLIWSSRVGR